MDGRIMFALPATPLVMVRYYRQGVKYDAVIPNPRTNERLQEVLLKRNVGISMVKFIAPMYERTDRRAERRAFAR